MNKREIKKMAKNGQMADLRRRLKKIEAIVISSPKRETTLRAEAVDILGVLDN